jgi:predicted ester cyclase
MSTEENKEIVGRWFTDFWGADFRAAFPDLAFVGTADLLAEGDYVVGQWIGGGTHTGAPMTDLPLGGLPEPNTGKTVRFTGTTVLKVQDGVIIEEVGLDDGVTVLGQLGLITQN